MQRADDGAEVVRERLRCFVAATRPLVEFYRSRSVHRKWAGRGRPTRCSPIGAGGGGGGPVIVCKSPAEIERMRPANVLVADVLVELRRMAVPGVTTAELDAFAERSVRAAGAVPGLRGTTGSRRRSASR